MRAWRLTLLEGRGVGGGRRPKVRLRDVQQRRVSVGLPVAHEHVLRPQGVVVARGGGRHAVRVGRVGRVAVVACGTWGSQRRGREAASKLAAVLRRAAAHDAVM